MDHFHGFDPEYHRKSHKRANIILVLLAVVGIFLVVWACTRPSFGAEPKAWLVPTFVIDGQSVPGWYRDGWHPRAYPDEASCDRQRIAAEDMHPPRGAARVHWACLPFDPTKGQDA